MKWHAFRNSSSHAQQNRNSFSTHPPMPLRTANAELEDTRRLSQIRSRRQCKTNETYETSTHAQSCAFAHDPTISWDRFETATPVPVKHVCLEIPAFSCTDYLSKDPRLVRHPTKWKMENAEDVKNGANLRDLPQTWKLKIWQWSKCAPVRLQKATTGLLWEVVFHGHQSTLPAALREHVEKPLKW